ncbi:MAG TPA: Calx-beta domain-containing protein, partial [Isosphaeraceae bacterium]
RAQTADTRGDYIPRGAPNGPPFTITFSNNDAAPKFVFIEVLSDQANLGNKTLRLVLSNPTNGATLAGPSEAVLTIADVPLFPQTVMFGAAAYAVSENNPNPNITGNTATITVSRSSGVGQVQVDYATSNGTARGDLDFTPTGGTLVFGPGEVVKTFTIRIADNILMDGNRTINVTLSNPSSNASVAIPSTVVLTIVDDDTPQPPVAPTVMFTMAAYSVSETAGTATLIVSRPDFAGMVMVDYATAGGTAAAGVKYLLTSGTLVFNPNETAKAFTIPILNTPAAEGTQTVDVVLLNPRGTRLGVPSLATLSILDDEPPPPPPPPPPPSPGVIGFGASAFTVSENGGTATITLVRTGGSAGAVTVNVATSGGSAAPGVKYTPVNQAVTFANGQTTATVSIRILDNTVADGNQTVVLTLSGPTGGATLGTLSAATLTILDNDPPDVTPPTITDVRLLGTGRTITGIELTFSEALDPARASNPANYTLLALGRDGVPGTRDDRAVAVRGVAYNAATGIVTIVPDRPLNGRQFYRLAVNAAAPGGLADPAGNRLDRGVGFSVSFARAPQLRYPDRNGDRVTLALRGGGLLELTRFADGEGRDLRVLGARPRRSVLSGAVQRRRRTGDGRTTLESITGIGAGGAARSRLRTPPFFIGQILPEGVDSLLAGDEDFGAR